MAKVTSKLQLTLPKVIADQYQIRPGDELDWQPAGEVIRVIKRSGTESARPASQEQRLELFDQATARQAKREKKVAKSARPSDRGWTREDLYDRGLPR
jgi:bifunctional DNA-binding transcriptional regulator/antitoxin component of YhaV-PrlF toxin-antitoxin module